MNISNQARELVWQAESSLHDQFSRIDATEMINTQRVLEAFWAERVGPRHFAPTNGYGYDDIGRDALDRVFAGAFGCQSALVRPIFVNGTHALFTMLAGISSPGTKILSITGDPYDTMMTAIGLSGKAPGSLKNFGIDFICLPIDESGSIQTEMVVNSIDDPDIKIIYVQRSRGYAWREAISIHCMKEVFDKIKSIRPDILIVVDNCYGEFTEVLEPVSVGADLMAGSLIKNPGGGLAPTGGYIAGKENLVDLCAQRLTLPGMGGEVGSYAGSYRLFYQGLFMAPHTTAQCLKSATLFARVFEMLGFPTLPASTASRSDIIQAVQFPTSSDLVSFCQCIQKSAPIDSDVLPEPWDMPGYDDQVVMAAGTFVQGATTELSADGPIRKPFTAYLQGALTYAHGRIAAMMVCDNFLRTAGENR